MSCFDQVGPDVIVLDGGRAVRKTADSHSFSLLSPVLSAGTSFASFRINSTPEPGSSDTFGVFPADLTLNSNILAASGKRCALQVWVGLDGAGRALVLCDGMECARHEGVP